MLPSDVVTHMCEFLSIRDYYTWRLTHKHAKSVYVEPKLRFKYAKDMFKEKRLLLKWCADFSCVNQVCTCIDLAKQETIVLSMYCFKHTSEYITNATELLF